MTTMEAFLFRLAAVFAMFAASGLAPAVANPATARMGLSAEVAGFCRIDADVRSVNESGSIGVVKEVCNAPGGYRVSAQFSNLKEAVVHADEDLLTLDHMGAAMVTADGPRSRARVWTLADVDAIDDSRPITVRFSIVPR
ncbi:hypothetical protein [Sphingomonas sp. LY160]|uniref:hypothetical protein n=1 Tax=Sphingomonas sp. LY160 TaxID=3095342 RepID=UPI002ADECE42|nr:hypothetical protein [Sphingomonas sp. LY160]MEA1072963.1 hypothetical protein [Sphingomonas sp. LY160]